MPISFKCPSCGRGLSAGEQLAGKSLRCPNCKQPVVVPAAQQSATPQSTTQQSAAQPNASSAPATVSTNAAAAPAKASQRTTSPPATAAQPTAAEDRCWYLTLADSQQVGPLTQREFDGWLQSGRLDPRCQVWHTSWPQARWAGEYCPTLNSQAPPLSPVAPAAALGYSMPQYPAGTAGAVATAGFAPQGGFDSAGGMGNAGFGMQFGSNPMLGEMGGGFAGAPAQAGHSSWDAYGASGAGGFSAPTGFGMPGDLPGMGGSFGMGASPAGFPASPGGFMQPGGFGASAGYAETESERPRKKKKKAASGRFWKSSDGPLMKVGKVALIVVPALAVLSLLIPFVGFLLLMVMAPVAGLMAAVGNLWLLAKAFEEGPLEGAMCFLIPFYSVYYLLTRWEECNLPGTLLLSSVGMFFSGVLMAVMSTINESILTALLG